MDSEALQEISAVHNIASVPTFVVFKVPEHQPLHTLSDSLMLAV